jgi:hypothetical protein
MSNWQTMNYFWELLILELAGVAMLVFLVASFVKATP